MADSVLLLCVEPGFSNQNPKISPIKRVRDFQNMFPNYTGKVSVDGGVKDFMLPQLKKLGVNIAVQGGAIFAR